jgi:hypothetical protein
VARSRHIILVELSRVLLYRYLEFKAKALSRSRTFRGAVEVCSPQKGMRLHPSKPKVSPMRGLKEQVFQAPGRRNQERLKSSMTPW